MCRLRRDGPPRGLEWKAMRSLAVRLPQRRAEVYGKLGPMCTVETSRRCDIASGPTCPSLVARPWLQRRGSRRRHVHSMMQSSHANRSGDRRDCSGVRLSGAGRMRGAQPYVARIFAEASEVGACDEWGAPCFPSLPRQDRVCNTSRDAVGPQDREQRARRGWGQAGSVTMGPGHHSRLCVAACLRFTLAAG